MLNETNYPSAVNSLCTVVKQEANSLGLPAVKANNFCAKMTWIAKGGSYQYGGSLPWTISWANGSLTGLPSKNSVRRRLADLLLLRRLRRRHDDHQPLAAERDLDRPQQRVPGGHAPLDPRGVADLVTCG